MAVMAKKKTWPTWALATCAVAGYIVGNLDAPGKLLKAADDVPALAKKTKDWWNTDPTFTGTWTSEGDMAATDEDIGGKSGPVAIDLTVYAGEADGVITTGGLKSAGIGPYTTILLRGRRVGSTLDVQAYDFVGGEEKIFANIKLTPAEGELILTTDGKSPLFPAKARVHRDSNAMPATEAGPSSAFMKAAKEHMKKRKLDR